MICVASARKNNSRLPNIDILYGLKIIELRIFEDETVAALSRKARNFIPFLL